MTIEHEDTEEYIPLGSIGRPSVTEEDGDRVGLVSPTPSVKKTHHRRARISSKPTIGVLNVSLITDSPPIIIIT